MKLKSAVSALVLALPALAATSAMAQSAATEGGFYAGGGLGLSNLKLDCMEGFSCSNSKVNLKLFGGYQFVPNFALEGGYMHFGKLKERFEEDRARYRLSAFTVAGVGIIPLSNEAQLFGKLGMHFSRGKASWTYPSLGVSDSMSDRKNGLLLGVGMQYDFTKNFTGRVEYEGLRYGRNQLLGHKDYLHLVSTSLMYKF